MTAPLMTAPPATAPPSPPPCRSTVRLALTLVAAVIVLFLIGRTARAYLPGFAAWINGLGVWGPVAFIAGYVVACVAFIPASLLTLAAGAIFGLVKGVAVVFVAATLAATTAFLISRYLAREALEQRLAGDARFVAIDRAIGVEGFKIVALLRLSPVLPFSLLNYALGLTQVRFTDYLLASIGMIPATTLYVYVGTLAGLVATLAGGAAVPHGLGFYAVWGLGLAATVTVTVVITRLARRGLQAATGPDAQTREMQTVPRPSTEVDPRRHS